MADKAQKACVIGYPITHSRSPLIHGYWLEKYSISGTYEKIEVAPDDLPGFLERIRSGEFVGCNVTIPHKESVFDLVKPGDDATAKLKAVNTVYRENGFLRGISTDGIGFFNHLEAEYPDWDTANKAIAIYGAGGAARAIIAEALVRGASCILLTNRTRGRAEDIAVEFGRGITVCDADHFPEHLSDVDLMVNTTSLGMTGQPQLELRLDRLKATAIVADIVYVPLQTELLKNAENSGFRTLDGLGMLLHQAAPGFARWFGREPEVTAELRNLVIADINAG